jgi:predicted dehydrogenase
VSDGLRVGIVGCGLIGRKRAAVLRAEDSLIGVFDTDPHARQSLGAGVGARACGDLDELLALSPDAVIVAVSHDALAECSVRALAAGAHVLVEKPAGIGIADVERIATAAAYADRRVKVGFNHRFHPGLARAAEEVRSGEHGELMHLRGRYGHGGRLGYDREWRADPLRSGGGELVDQGMHLLDLSHWIAGPLPLHAAILRTQFWDMPVEDNAALLLGDPGLRRGPWAMLHVTWTEWKNLFSIEVYCRTAKLQVDGLTGSYGPQRLRIYRMAPSLGPPELEEITYPAADPSWAAEWSNFTQRIADGAAMLGDLADARYAWECVEAAYEQAASVAGAEWVSP